MDKRLEKYYNFIVTDMVKDTVVNHDLSAIYYPDYPEDEMELDDLEAHTRPLHMKKYLKQKYGASDEDLNPICNLYYDKLYSMIYD